MEARGREEKMDFLKSAFGLGVSMATEDTDQPETVAESAAVSGADSDASLDEGEAEKRGSEYNDDAEDEQDNSSLGNDNEDDSGGASG